MSGESTFTCPSCQKRYRWKFEIAGRSVRCKSCGHKLRVPEATDEDAGAGTQAVAAEAQPPSRAAKSCPSCGQSLSAKAVVCVHCGFNLQTGEALDTSVGLAVKQAAGASRRVQRTVHREGFLDRIRRSWEYVKISYGILWDFKQLLIFPLLSLVATVLVLVSFAMPIWGLGTMEQFQAFMDDETATGQVDVLVYAIAFAFYFCCYFVIVFFNTALSACALRVCAGETPTVGYGLSLACRRLPQIVAWALVSATVGLLLKIIENANEKVGAIIAAILGTGWTILTFFVVPVLAAQGVGPVEAFKQALSTLKKTWGEGLAGNFSIALITMLIAMPLGIILGMAIVLALLNGQLLLAAAAFVTLIVAAILLSVVSSAADMVFRSLLYNYATGQTIPEDVDEALLEAAFGTNAE